MLEEEKAQLLIENLQKEKIIAKNKQQRLFLEFRLIRKKSQHQLHKYFCFFIFLYEFYICFI